MCLIVHSPQGELIERRVFDYARAMNSDGIGVMSALGIEKFLGRKSGKRAWRYLRRLAVDSIPYGLHFRWATHGNVTRDNCHPFYVPASGATVMHNGVLRQTASRATAARSDTALFVEQFMAAIPAPEMSGHAGFFERLGKFIGWNNTMLVFHHVASQFTICNEEEGHWIDGMWYSNDYSLPDDMSPWINYKVPTAADAGIGTGARWADIDRDYPLASTTPTTRGEYPLWDARNEYADRNVADAVSRQPFDYYAEIEGADGYFDDGADVGTRAAMRSMLDGPDREFQKYLKRAKFPVAA